MAEQNRWLVRSSFRSPSLLSGKSWTAALSVCAAFAFPLVTACCASHVQLVVHEEALAASPESSGPDGRDAAVRPGRNFHGHPGQVRRGFRIIRNQESWAALWPRGFEPPQVDFSKEIVLAAFQGEVAGPGHRIAFDGARRNGKKLEVRLSEHVPPQGCSQTVAAGEDSAPSTFRPALLLSFAREELREVHLFVAQKKGTTCLLPPPLSISCRVEDEGNVGGDAAYSGPGYRNVLGVPLPRKGDRVVCEGATEPEARVSFTMVAHPENSTVLLKKLGRNAVSFVPDVDGGYRIGGEASRGDGFVASEAVSVEAGSALYSVELTEEEPEGLLGYSLVLERRLPEDSSESADDGEDDDESGDVGPVETADAVPSKADGEASGGIDAAKGLEVAGPDRASGNSGGSDVEGEEVDPEEGEEEDDGDSHRLCSAATPEKWCAYSSDGIVASAVFPSFLRGDMAVRVARAKGAPPPQATLRILLAGHEIGAYRLPDDLAFWRDLDENADRQGAPIAEILIRDGKAESLVKR